MKMTILALAALFSVSAFAASKTYNCASEFAGPISPDEITVVLYSSQESDQVETLVFSYPGWSAADYPQPVAERVVGAGDNGGAIFDLAKNEKEFLVSWRAYQYNVTRIRVSNGMLRGDASGTLTVSYDDVGAASGSWTRQYPCVEKN